MQTPEKTNNVDLLQLLEQKTAFKETENFEISESKEAEFQTHISEDFDQNIINQEPQPEPASQPEPTQEIENPVDYKAQAKMIIAAVDGIQSLALPFLYEKSYFSYKEKDILLKWKRTGKPATEEMTDDEKGLNSKYNDYIKQCDSVPFSDDEEETLQNPLSEVLKKRQFKTSPEMLLLGALLAVMAPRLLPLFYPIERKISGSGKN